ncbi:MAG: MFS transporter [Pseudobutyrivibrio sp.]|nr:MFS transporter [Pseudobutyrivibrio sp.]
MDKNKARKQIKKLYLVDSLGGLMIGGASWVALLAARGFSTIEIGFAESIFHIASIMFEIPSGALADVFGRKKIMILSSFMTIVSSVLMILSKSFAGIAVTMVFSALSYNLASGTREALAYDSLKEAGIEDEYNKFASNDLMIYQIFSSLGTLMVGVALMLGYKKANAVDAILAFICVIIGLTFFEVKTELNQKQSVIGRFKEVAVESVRFIKENRKARLIILFNALTGAISILILFFLQAKLPALGLKSIWLGPALFAMGMGAALGSKAIELFQKYRYRTIGIISLVGVSLAFTSLFTRNVWIIIVCGFIGAFSDNFLEVRTDVLLNSMVPSDQRATLMSINSFTFSVIMVVLAPLFGIIFGMI